MSNSKYDDVKEVLPFAGDFESSHVARDYPYGRLRTDMHFYIEHKKGHGFRAVNRSLNPKTGTYNKPKKGTYTEAIACYLDSIGRIKFASFSHYDREQAKEFYNIFESGLSLDGKRTVKFWQFVHEESEALKKELKTDSLYGISGAFKIVEGKAIGRASEFVKSVFFKTPSVGRNTKPRIRCERKRQT